MVRFSFFPGNEKSVSGSWRADSILVFFTDLAQSISGFAPHGGLHSTAVGVTDPLGRFGYIFRVSDHCVRDNLRRADGNVRKKGGKEETHRVPGENETDRHDALQLCE